VLPEAGSAGLTVTVGSLLTLTWAGVDFRLVVRQFVVALRATSKLLGQPKLQLGTHVTFTEEPLATAKDTQRHQQTSHQCSIVRSEEVACVCAR
jgi:hypothetical protein